MFQQFFIVLIVLAALHVQVRSLGAQAQRLGIECVSGAARESVL